MEIDNLIFVPLRWDMCARLSFIERKPSGYPKKQMKINDIFDRFTSKAYSAAILSKFFHLYQLKVPKQLTKKFSIFSQMGYFAT